MICDFCFKEVNENKAIKKNIDHKRCCLCSKECLKNYIAVECRKGMPEK